MQGRGFIRFVAVLLAIACIYHLSFTFVTAKVESDAKKYANGDTAKENYYLDSVAFEPVYNLGFASFTFQECKEKQLNLGLDLKGGMNVTMEVSMADLVRSMANNPGNANFNKAIDIAQQESQTSSQDFVALFAQAYQKLEPNGKLAVFFATPDNKNLITINSTNAEVVSVLQKEAESAFDRSFEILRTRIDKFGVSQPNIQKIGSNRILIELPGISEPDRVRRLLQGSAKLEFWETYDNREVFSGLEQTNQAIAKQLSIIESAAASTPQTVVSQDTASSSLIGKIQAAGGVEAEGLTASLTKQNPLFSILSPNVYDGPSGQQLAPGAAVGYASFKDTARVNAYLNSPDAVLFFPANLRFAWGVKAINGKDLFALYALKGTGRSNTAALEGNVISSARADYDQLTGKPEVVMIMNAEGTREWKKITAAAAAANHRAVAIVLDNAVYSAPSVSNEISGGISSISGSFTPEETQDLANVLKAGKLPAPAKIVEEATVGPTLGQEAIDAGLISCIAGLAVVFIFMALYYQKAGITADIALALNIFLMLGVLASFGAVLTLPGIAGIVLNIGMAVDANVLIYERIKEELRHGKTLKVAVADGFKHAYSAIIDANVTILLLGIILYSFSSGLIQGFATTLVIGIFTSLFSAVFITRLIFEAQIAKEKSISFDSNISRSLFGGKKFDFVGRRKTFYIVSSVIILLGLGSALTRGFSLGVDFQGGRTYTVRFADDVKVSEIREALTIVFDGQAPEVKTFGGVNQVRITTAYEINNNSDTVDKEVENKLLQGLIGIDGGSAQIMDSRKVGPTIASDIRQSAFSSIGLALVVIFIYILIRFKRWQFGLGATVALFHDVLVILSIFSIFNGILPFSLDIDQTFIAAILTIMGYSMNDTVVVFDRLREELALHHTKNDHIPSVINGALNNTLNRTLITSLSTLLVLIVLFIFGGAVLRGFSFALLVGVLVGTYSSLFVATPIVVDFFDTKKLDKKESNRS